MSLTIITTIIISLCLLPMIIHRIDEGHIGVYYLGGALKEGTTEPGFHLKLPMVTSYDQVQTTMQTDTVTNIPCGTSGGVLIHFEKIEVVNRLDKDKAWQTIKNYGANYDKTWIFDKIHHEVNQFCSSNTLQDVYIDKFPELDEALAKALQEDCDKYNTGIHIIAIRVTKPSIPSSVEANYRAIEEQKTNLKVATEKQRVTQKESETKLMSAKIEADTNKQVAIINAEREESISIINARTAIAEKEAQKKKALIDNEIYLAKQKGEADALFYKLEKEALGNVKRLTPEYLQYVMYTSISNNTKIYFGESIPKALNMQNIISV